VDPKALDIRYDGLDRDLRAGLSRPILTAGGDFRPLRHADQLDAAHRRSGALGRRERGPAIDDDKCAREQQRTHIKPP